MASEQLLMAIKGVLEADRRRWATVSDLIGGGPSKPYLIEIRVRGADKAGVETQAQRLSSEIEGLDFDVEVEDARDVLVEKADPYAVATFVVVLTVSVLSLPKLLNDSAEACRLLPQNIRALLARFRDSDEEVDTHELLVLEAIREWLDSKYGPNAWQYDPDEAEIKPIADVTMMDLVETKSGTRHLLAVHDGIAQEVPQKWRTLPVRKEVT